MNDGLNWKNDLADLIGEKLLRALSDLIDDRKRLRARAIRSLCCLLLFLFFIAVISVWLFTGWKNSIRADVANGVIALELAMSALLVRFLPTISKDEVEETVQMAVLNTTFSKIKEDVGGGSERLQRWIAFFAAIALLAVILLKSFVPDVAKPKNNKEVDHGARQVPAHGRTLSP